MKGEVDENQYVRNWRRAIMRVSGIRKCGKVKGRGWGKIRGEIFRSYLTKRDEFHELKGWCSRKEKKSGTTAIFRFGSLPNVLGWHVSNFTTRHKYTHIYCTCSNFQMLSRVWILEAVAFDAYLLLRRTENPNNRSVLTSTIKKSFDKTKREKSSEETKKKKEC